MPVTPPTTEPTLDSDSFRLLYWVLSGVGIGIAGGAYALWKYIVKNHAKEINGLKGQISELKENVQKLQDTMDDIRELHKAEMGEMQSQYREVHKAYNILNSDHLILQTKLAMIIEQAKSRKLDRDDIERIMNVGPEDTSFNLTLGRMHGI